MSYKNISDFNGIELLEKNIFFSDLGSFSTLFESRDLEISFVQDSISKSLQTGTIRGMHFQKGQDAQAKLINVLQGAIVDFFVDLRKSSPTFLCHGCVELNEDSLLSLFIPKGFAHGFLVLSEKALFTYKCDEYYCSQNEFTIAWNDKGIGIKWPNEFPKLSHKDTKAENGAAD